MIIITRALLRLETAMNLLCHYSGRHYSGRRTLDDLKTVQEAIGDPVRDCVPVVNTRLQI